MWFFPSKISFLWKQQYLQFHRKVINPFESFRTCRVHHCYYLEIQRWKICSQYVQWFGGFHTHTVAKPFLCALDVHMFQETSIMQLMVIHGLWWTKKPSSSTVGSSMKCLFTSLPDHYRHQMSSGLKLDEEILQLPRIVGGIKTGEQGCHGAVL